MSMTKGIVITVVIALVVVIAYTTWQARKAKA